MYSAYIRTRLAIHLCVQIERLREEGKRRIAEHEEQLRKEFLKTSGTYSRLLCEGYHCPVLSHFTWCMELYDSRASSHSAWSCMTVGPLHMVYGAV